jgi:hypothetical protein
MTLTTRDAGAYIQRYFSALSAWFDSVEGRARQLQNSRIRMQTLALSRELAAPGTQDALAGDAPPELLEALYRRCVTLLSLCGLTALIPRGMETVNVIGQLSNPNVKPAV